MPDRLEKKGYLGSSEQRNGRQSDACFTKPARAGALWRQRRPEVRELFGELIVKNGFANFIDGATNLAAQDYYGSASKASSDGVDPPFSLLPLRASRFFPREG